MEMALNIVLFIIGLAILIKGSDFFVGSAAYLAKHFGVSEFIIGLTLVSMGTSLPELGASVYAASTGKGGIAVGNVVGSNVANIALVLGACLLIRSITVKKDMLRRDGLIMLGISLLFTLFVFGDIVRWEGLVLMGLFVAYIVYLYKQNKSEKTRTDICEVSDRFCPKDGKMSREVLKLILGCIGVFIGAKLMVDSAVFIASSLGISESVIGSTLIAFGTSVPELAVSLTAIVKKYEDISIGNIIGSNIFNILWVIGAAALISDLVVDSTLLYINIPLMLFVAALLLVFMATGKKLRPWQGGVFVAIYGMFLFLNFWS